MLKKLMLCVALGSLLGCATSMDDTASLPVDVLPESAVSSCEFIQQLSANKTNMMNSVNAKIQQAQMEIANRALELGGDALVIEDTDVTGNGHVVNVRASVYSCSN